jgi:hypothetical protein
MPSGQPWEYAIVFVSSDHTIRVTYVAEDDVDEEERPYRVIYLTLGELGRKGWELVNVVSLESSRGGRISEYYFKRPHHPNRDLNE